MMPLPLKPISELHRSAQLQVIHLVLQEPKILDLRLLFKAEGVIHHCDLKHCQNRILDRIQAKTSTTTTTVMVLF